MFLKVKILFKSPTVKPVRISLKKVIRKYKIPRNQTFGALYDGLNISF